VRPSARSITPRPTREPLPQSGTGEPVEAQVAAAAAQRAEFPPHADALVGLAQVTRHLITRAEHHLHHRRIARLPALACPARARVGGHRRAIARVEHLLKAHDVGPHALEEAPRVVDDRRPGEPVAVVAIRDLGLRRSVAVLGRQLVARPGAGAGVERDRDERGAPAAGQHGETQPRAHQDRRLRPSAAIDQRSLLRNSVGVQKLLEHLVQLYRATVKLRGQSARTREQLAHALGLATAQDLRELVSELELLEGRLSRYRQERR
jgi:hypothetical protein